jgi:CubicO group peptidase (beta-lactamase class C family)
LAPPDRVDRLFGEAPALGHHRLMAKIGELDIKTTLGGLETKAGVDELLNRRAAVGLAVGVVRNGSLEFFQAHGLADIGPASGPRQFDIYSPTLPGSPRFYTRPIC